MLQTARVSAPALRTRVYYNYEKCDIPYCLPNLWRWTKSRTSFRFWYYPSPDGFCNS